MLCKLSLILSLVTVVFCLGCNVENPFLDIFPKQDLVPAELGSQFQIKIDQTGLIRSENIKVTFLDVTEDSRCPSDVTCIWAGQAKIIVNILKHYQDIGDLTLTSGAGNGDLATKAFDGYSIELVKVDPYPISTEKIELSDYIITLVVTNTTTMVQ